MSDWTSGYVAEVGYTYGHYAELSPERLRMAFLSAGLLMPAIGAACELGFGQGVSANIHASATLVHWHGNDFLPAQAAYAQELAAASGSGGRFTDQAFADFCNDPTLPDFDFISLHGIWSWVSDENRAVIVDFVRRKLKVGGVLYVSYNTQPGWASMIPMRHLLTEHARVMGSEGQGMLGRIGNAMEFGEQLLALDPAYARANPEVKTRFAKLKAHDRAYLAHEYFNRDWEPMPFSRMAQWLAPAKVEFACSAHLLEHADELQFTPAQQAFLKKIPNEPFRQTVRDYLVDQQFRRDYWVKGLRRIGIIEQLEQWRQLRVVLVKPRAEVVLKVKGNLGETELKAEQYGPILDALADQQVHRIADIEQLPAVKGMALPVLLSSLRMLYAKGDIAVAQDEAVTAQVAERCKRLNAHLMNRSRAAIECLFLASPITGTGVPVMRMDQLFLLARNAGGKTPADWAAYVWDILQNNREKVVKDGRVLDGAADSLAEVTRQAEDFAKTRLPVLDALGVR